jgi:hypothetical protein
LHPLEITYRHSASGENIGTVKIPWRRQWNRLAG